MAQVWQRLVDQYADGTRPLDSQQRAGDHPPMQQQQQIQPRDDNKE
jgi:hypothetical protein